MQIFRGCNIEYLGRIDTQVKIRGFRIEIGEIESVLNKHKYIKDAVVVVQGEGENKKLICFYVINSKDKKLLELDVDDLREYLKNHLPDYMIPSAFIVMDKIPLTPNGKVDRKMLEKKEVMITSNQEYEAATNNVQKSLTKIFQDVLKLDKIGINDNFFEIGGNSLLVTQAVTKINNKFKSQFDIHTFFLNPNIKEIAKYLENGQSENINNQVSLESETVDANETYYCNQQGDYKNPKTIFITGTTGFVGVHLLQNLLLETKAHTIYCLVRGKSQKNCHEKLNAALEKYKIKIKKSDLEKIKVIKGDLEKTRIGIKETDYENLISTVDLIIHVGAFVNHLYNYARLRKANVRSTYELIKMAKKIRKKKLIFISTMSVVKDKKEYKNGENADIESLHFKETEGYTASKWVCEAMIKNSKIDYQIHRISRAGGSTKSNIGPENDLTYRYWKTCLMLKKYPEEFDNWYEDIRPIDQTTQIMTDLILKSELNHDVFHLNNKKKISINKPLEIVKKSKSLEKISLDNWLELLEKGELNGKLLPFYPYLGLVKAFVKNLTNKKYKINDRHIDNTNTMKLIEKENRIFEFNDDQLALYIKQCQRED